MEQTHTEEVRRSLSGVELGEGLAELMRVQVAHMRQLVALSNDTAAMKRALKRLHQTPLFGSQPSRANATELLLIDVVEAMEIFADHVELWAFALEETPEQA